MEEPTVEISSVKVGFKSYAIERPTEINEVKGGYYGTSDCDAEVIKIASKFKQHDKNCTLIHELLHCICVRFGLIELNGDEKTVDLLANGIYEIIIDNPGLFKMTDI